MQLEEAVKKYQENQNELNYFRKIKFLRNVLKIIIIGFFIGKDIDITIKNLRKKRKYLIESLNYQLSKHLNSLRKQIKNVERYESYLTQKEVEQWLDTLKSFMADIYYLMLQETIDKKYISEILDEIQKYRNFILNYNLEYKKRKTNEKIELLKNNILTAEKEYDSFNNNQLYFSKRDMYTWEREWNYIKQPIYEFTKIDDNVDFQDSILKILNIYQNGEEIRKNRNQKFIEK